MATYSGKRSSTASTRAVPRTASTWYGHSLLSTLRATAGRSARTFILGAFGGAPMSRSSPVQWNHIGTTRGDPSRQV